MNPNTSAPDNNVPPPQGPAAEPTPVQTLASTPIGSAPVGGAPQGPTKDKKKLIAIAVGALVIVVAAALVVSSFFSVSKQDYADAVEQYNQVARANSSLNLSASSLARSLSSGSDVTFDERLEETNEAIEKIKTENEAFGKLKAVRVGEGAKLYKTFNEKLEAYLAYTDKTMSSVKSLRPALVVCGEVSGSSGADARVVALKNCADALGKVGDVADADYKAYATALKEAYSDYASIYESINALNSPYGAQYEQYKTLRDQMYDAQDKVSDASKKFSDALNKRSDELSVKESAEALAEYLHDKQ